MISSSPITAKPSPGFRNPHVYRSFFMSKLDNLLNDLVIANRILANEDIVDAYGHVSVRIRSEEHTSELQSHSDLVCRLLLEKKKNTTCENKDECPQIRANPEDGQRAAKDQLANKTRRNADIARIHRPITTSPLMPGLQPQQH